MSNIAKEKEKTQKVKLQAAKYQKMFICSTNLTDIISIREPYRWPAKLLAIVVQHSSTIKDKKPSLPITSQV